MHLGSYSQKDGRNMVGEGEVFLGVRKEWLAAIDWWSSGIFIGISQFLIGWPLLGFILQTSRSLPGGRECVVLWVCAVVSCVWDGLYWVSFLFSEC